MKAGQLRHRVTLQRPLATVDGYGQPIQSWVDDATVSAAIEPLSGREYFAAQQVNREVTLRVRVRYRADITPEWRLSRQGKTYGIDAVIDPRTGHEELHLMCRELK